MEGCYGIHGETQDEPEATGGQPPDPHLDVGVVNRGGKGEQAGEQVGGREGDEVGVGRGAEGGVENVAQNDEQVSHDGESDEGEGDEEEENLESYVTHVFERFLVMLSSVCLTEVGIKLHEKSICCKI